MAKHWLHTIWFGTCLALGGCATNFQGSAYVEGGRAECEKKCAAEGLVMSSIVYMGEYSSACVCEVPGRQAAPPAAPSPAPAAAATTGAIGVIMQMRRAQEQNNQVAMMPAH